MPAPIRGAWFERPNVSGFRTYRVHGFHHGFDSYTLPRTTIYAIGVGRVVAKGYDATGFGHWVDVFYPDLNYREREAHMNEATYLAIGAKVTANTALGRVGNTGNAANIVWVRAGVSLRHVHSEGHRGNTTALAALIDPRGVWDATPASGDITPIDSQPDRPSRFGDTMLFMNRDKDNVVAIFDESHWQEIAYSASATSGTPLEVTTRYVYGLTHSLAEVPYDGVGWDHRSNRMPELKRDVFKIEASGALTPLVGAGTPSAPAAGGASKADLDAAETRIIEAIPTSFVAQG